MATVTTLLAPASRAVTIVDVARRHHNDNGAIRQCLMPPDLCRNKGYTINKRLPPMVQLTAGFSTRTLTSERRREDGGIPFDLPKEVDRTGRRTLFTGRSRSPKMQNACPGGQH